MFERPSSAIARLDHHSRAPFELWIIPLLLHVMRPLAPVEACAASFAASFAAGFAASFASRDFVEVVAWTEFALEDDPAPVQARRNREAARVVEEPRLS
jgi:hypothetical protein|tara:strand:- start:790 stop:1086 length:297 start_codon:yes stop_codon:yes gene_type:complete